MNLQGEKIENPLKRIACHLAHQMADERKMNTISMPQWKMDEIKAWGKELRDEIWQNGYDVATILQYAEECKKLTTKEYLEWRFI